MKLEKLIIMIILGIGLKRLVNFVKWWKDKNDLFEC